MKRRKNLIEFFLLSLFSFPFFVSIVYPQKIQDFLDVVNVWLLNVLQLREVYRVTEGLHRDRASLLKQLDLLRSAPASCAFKDDTWLFL